MLARRPLPLCGVGFRLEPGVRREVKYHCFIKCRRFFASARFAWSVRLLSPLPALACSWLVIPCCRGPATHSATPSLMYHSDRPCRLFRPFEAVTVLANVASGALALPALPRQALFPAHLPAHPPIWFLFETPGCWLSPARLQDSLWIWRSWPGAPTSCRF